MKHFNSILQIGYAFSLAIIFSSTTNAQNCLPKLAHDSLQLVTDGTIFCSEKKGDTIFIGGHFNYIGKYTGGMAPVDSTGKVIRPGDWPRVHGYVYDMAPDGNGGFYIGGRFNKVGDSVRTNLAHINSSGQVTSFKVDIVCDTINPKIAAIRSILLHNNRLYIAGWFKYVNNRVRQNAACIDISTNKLTPWHPYLNDRVNAMLMYNNKIYLGGRFTLCGYDKSNTKFIVAVDTITGMRTGWSPALNGQVLDMYVDSNRLYIAGKFTGMARSYDLTTGNQNTWSPAITQNSSTSVNTICVLGNKVYMGGDFKEVGGKVRQNLAAVDKYSGSVANWSPFYEGNANRIRPYKNKLYVGGAGIVPNFRFIIRYIFASFDTIGNLDPWAPQSMYIGSSYTSGGYNGGPCNFLFDSYKIYLMGEINSVGGQIRRGLAAFNSKTSEILPFSPDVNINGGNHTVNALKRNKDLLYVGGRFESINGKWIQNLVAYNIAGDSVMPWKVGSMSDNLSPPTVYAIEVLDNNVYVGGIFSTVSGQNRRNLFAADSATGWLTGWAPGNPNTYGPACKIKAKGNSIFIGGGFTSLGGNSRTCIGVADLSGNILPWNMNSSTLGPVTDIDFIGNSVYVTSYYGVKKVDTTTSSSSPAVATWNAIPDTGNLTLLYYNNKIYAGGEFKMSGEVDTSSTASPSTMTLGHGDSYNRKIYDINNVDSNLYAFGDFACINDGEKTLRGIARFNISTKADTGFAKLVVPDKLCSSPNQHQLWAVNTNLQTPTYTWYKNGNIAVTTSSKPMTELNVQNGDTVYCIVKAGTGCYVSQSVTSDTIIVTAATPVNVNGKLIGPNVVCSTVPSKYVMKVNNGVSSYWWIYNNVNINNNTNSYTFTPAATGRLACWFNMPDTGCYTNDIGADSIDITSIVPQITPAYTITPPTFANICEGDTAIIVMNSNFHWGAHQWSINGLNVGLDSDTLLVPSLGMNDTVKCVIVADTPNCFTSQMLVGSKVTNPQIVRTPTISINGPSTIGEYAPVNLQANFIDAGSNYSIEWKKNGSAFDTTVTNTTSYTKGTGTDSITATITPVGCYNPATSAIFTIAESVGIQSIYNNHDISVYPNPFNNKISIIGLLKGDILEVYDVFSRSVRKISMTETTRIYEVHLQNLVPGTYILEVKNSEGHRKSISRLQKQ